MKIGLMGGTFNPIHLAHLRIAEEARELCGLDRVIFIPAADPPHKPLAGDISFAHRSEMVKRAIANNPAFYFSDIEGYRTGKSYSIETIEYFRKEHPEYNLHFIIGSDSFLEFGLWHRYADIISSCNLIVIERPDCPIIDPLNSLPVAIRSELHYNAEARRLEHEAGVSIQFFSGCLLEISSSEIRRLAACKRSIKYLVPQEVEAYINDQRIYTECP